MSYSQELFQYFFYHTNSGMVAFEPVYTNEVLSDLQITHSNKAFEQLVGCHNVEGKTINQILPDFGTYNPEVMNLFDDVCKDGIQQQIEIYAKKLSKWLSINILTPDRKTFIANITDITSRKQNEIALKDIQVKYDSMLNSDTIGIGIAKEGMAIYVNRTLQQMLEYSEEELYNQSFINLFHPDDRILLIERMKKRAAGEYLPNVLIVRVLTKSGNIKYIQHNTTDFAIGNELYVQSIVVDVTQRIEAERELRNSEEKFKILFEQAAVGVAQLNTNTGQFVKVNAKYLEIMGYGLDEMLKLDFQTITHPDDLSPDLQFMEKLKAGIIQDFNMEKRLIHKNGSFVWVSLSVSAMWKPGEDPDYHIAVVQDITPQKKLELERRKLRVAVEQSPVTIAITDLNGTIEYVNPAFCKITGYSLEETIGQNPRFLNSGITPVETFDEMWTTLSKGNTWIGEFINKKKNGDLYYEEAIISPVIDESNAIVNYLAVKNDITYKKLQEELIRKNNRQLMELNATKDKFFSIIAHDLKNPFNSIVGFSDLLCNHMDEYSREKIFSFVKTINESAQNAFKLLENLLVWAHSQLGRMEFKPKFIIVENLFHETVSLLHTNCLAKNITIKSEINDSISLFADKEMLSSILRNLVSNAIKYTPMNGNILLMADANDNEVIFTVKDSGVGIHEKKVDLLFKINEKVTTPGTNNESGTGLGLVLCKEFVERHCGRIWIESTGKEGTTFKFSIPLTPVQ